MARDRPVHMAEDHLVRLALLQHFPERVAVQKPDLVHVRNTEIERRVMDREHERHV